MKTLLSFLFILSITFLNYGQADYHRMQRGPMGKIEELEKIKLIETLQMNEETTLRFFARRTEHQNKLRELSQKANEQLDKISDYIKKNGDKNSVELKKMINDYLSYGEAIAREKTNFINSLSDILTYEQISKLLVFEKNFRDELRKIIFRGRMRKDR